MTFRWWCSDCWEAVSTQTTKSWEALSGTGVWISSLHPISSLVRR